MDDVFKELIPSKRRNKRRSNQPWTVEEKEIVASLVEENQMYRDISSVLKSKGYNRSAEAVRKIAKKEKKKTEYTPPDKSQHYIDTEMEIDFSDTLIMLEEKRQRLFNIITERYEKVGNPTGRLHKIASISDLHIPWVNDNVIADMISKHSDAEVLVINGDILEQFSVSRWPKNKSVLLRHEYEVGMEYIRQFSKIFKRVILIRGNHEDRLRSYFSSNLDPNVCFVTHPDLLERIANGYGFDEYGNFRQMYDLENVYYKGGLSGWYAKVGNCIFAHPKGGSKIPMRTSVNVADYFLEKEDFDAVVVAHTHKLGQIIWKGKMVIEQGCCCVPMDYEADAKMQYSQQAFGYCVVYMNRKGKVDFDKSKPVYYGTATAVDADIRMLPGE